MQKILTGVKPGRDVFIRCRNQYGVSAPDPLVNHDNFADRMALRRRRFIQISALSTFDCRIEAYNGFNG